MATWAEMGGDNLRAAKLLLDHGMLRSAASRAYYAAYSALTSVFESRSVAFTHGGNNPSHDQLLALTANNVNSRIFPRTVRRQVKHAVLVLQATRINADYNPRTTIDRLIALQMVRQAPMVVSIVAERQ